MDIFRRLSRFRRTIRVALNGIRGWGRKSLQTINASWCGIALFVILVFPLGIGIWRLFASWNWLSTGFWTWLRMDSNGTETHSTTLRNLGLLVAAAIALPLAIWRSWVAQRQADTAQKNLLNERYRQGAEMLDSKVLAVRLGGIYALQRLAADNPKKYHIQIMQLLCAFVRHPPPVDGERNEPVAGNQTSLELRSDVQDAIDSISICRARQTELEVAAGFRLDLHGVNLRGAVLLKARFGNADLSKADLTGAELIDADLASANIGHAILNDARLNGADLSSSIFNNAQMCRTQLPGANLVESDLSNAKIEGARVSEAKLSKANLYKANLTGVFLQNSDLSEARLQCANLTDASLYKANLAGATLSHANLTEADLSGSNLLGSDLSDANVSNAKLSPLSVITPRVGNDPIRREIPTKITQAQLDVARAEPGNPPMLDRAEDTETGNPLVWRGKPLNSET